MNWKFLPMQKSICLYMLKKCAIEYSNTSRKYLLQLKLGHSSYCNCDNLPDYGKHDYNYNKQHT